MQTFTGRRFYPLDPRPDEIDPVDLAHALSLLCRYGGHVDRFYSVAEHCVLMSQSVAPEYALWALLHDATEAYVGDMVRPLKLQMPEYRAVEDRVELAIASHFRIDVTPTMHTAVKRVDTRILIDERAELLGPSPHGWSSLDGMQPLCVEIVGWSPVVAEAMYLARFRELTTETAIA